MTNGNGPLSNKFNRVEKSSGKIYWYGAGTEILDESDTSGNITNEYVFFGGKRIAMRNVSSGTIYYYEDDMLGSARTIVQAGQTSACYDGDFYPFGGERIITNTCAQNYKFEGKERDTETGNDDFGARYYSSRLGRWLSSDWSAVPAPVPYANLTNPQTLNLYAMLSDNPETFADLDGHLIQGGPYNLETADFSGGAGQGNCDYMGGDCSLNAFGNDNSGVPDWYFSEVSAQQQNSTPSRFAITGSKQLNSHARVYYYQLENSKGQALTGNGYSVEEHLTGDVPPGSRTSEKQFVPLKHGVAPDEVGFVHQPKPGAREDLVQYQTFTVKYAGKNYNLTTEFKHEEVADTVKGKVVITIRDTPIVP